MKQIFPEKEYRGLSPNFHIHVSVSELYIPTMGLPSHHIILRCEAPASLANLLRLLPFPDEGRRSPGCIAGPTTLKTSWPLPSSSALTADSVRALDTAVASESRKWLLISAESLTTTPFPPPHSPSSNQHPFFPTAYFCKV